MNNKILNNNKIKDKKEEMNKMKETEKNKMKEIEENKYK